MAKAAKYHNLDLEQMFDYNIVNQFVHLGRFSLLMSVLVAVLVYLVFRVHVEPVLLNLWALMILVSTFLRAALIVWFWRMEIERQKLRSWMIAYLGLIYVSAACWGSLPLFAVFQTTDWIKSFIYLVLAGMSAGGIVSLYPLLMAAIPYILIVLAPILVVTSSVEDPVFTIMAIMTGLYIVVLVRSAFVLNHYSNQAIRLELENKKLFKFLSDAREAELSKQKKVKSIRFQTTSKKLLPGKVKRQQKFRWRRSMHLAGSLTEESSLQKSATIPRIMSVVHRALPLLSLVLLVSLSAPDLQAAPADYDFLLKQALEARDAGDFVSAEKSLRAARELALHTNEVDYWLGMMLAFQDHLSDALTVIDAALRTYPNDLQLQIGKARVLSYHGRYSESLQWVQKVLDVQPGNTEALILAARINYYGQQLDRARELYILALGKKPDNLEGLLGLYDVELAAGNHETASAILDRAAAAEPENADVSLRRERPVSAPAYRHEFTSGLMVSDFDVSGLRRWHDKSSEYRYRFENGNQFYLRNEHLHRFGSHDSLGEVGLLLNQGSSFPAEVAFAYGSDAEFSPKQQVRLATTLPLLKGTTEVGPSMLELGYSHAEYRTGEVDTYRLGISHYFRDFDGWLNTGALWVVDETGKGSTGWTTNMNWQATSKLRLGVGYADAPETENNVTTDTRSHFVYARYQLFDNLALRLDGSRNERERSYTRETVSLSLQFRF
jgi:YaiO family outer membrane protein